MYATVSDMRARFEDAELIQLSDQAEAGVMDTVVIESALDDASAEIDSYLAKKYDLPLASTPAVLVRTCADMARYNLFTRKGDCPDAVKNANDRAMSWLKAIASGLAALDIAGSEPETAANDILVADNLIASRRCDLGGF